jgi:TusA-related sulfurtransferase
MRIADTRGQKCPAPLIATRKAIRESDSGESIKVITDSKNASGNISRFLKDNGIHFEIEEKEGLWTIIITKSIGSGPLKNAEDYCNPDVPNLKKDEHES